MKRGLLVVIVLAICAILVFTLWPRDKKPAASEGRVAFADDRDFYPVLHNLLSEAQSSVDVILYQSRFYFHYPLSASNTLLNDLVEASARGARVRVVMETADWNLSNTEENRDVWHVLRGNNIELYFDPDTTTTHSKLVIVDGRYVVVGSSNWSHYALDNNSEANVIVDSKGTAEGFKTYFEKIIARSNADFAPSIEPMAAADIASVEGRYVLIHDVPDSAVYDGLNAMGRIYFGDVLVGVVDRPLEEIMTVDSLFFQRAAGESVRVMARFQGQSRMTVEALDVELKDTPDAMVRCFEAERAMQRERKSHPPEIEWIEGARIRSAANREYAEELTRLFRGAESRIWAALSDARYYDEKPYAARLVKGPDEPVSLTNVILEELVDAAEAGVDVRFAIDMGWRGDPPASKTAFMDRLASAGARMYEDPGDVTTHAKLLIVDEDYVVVGSTNWSYFAFEESNETSVVIHSPELNRHYADYIENIIDAGTPYQGAR
jgi:phosphatidylserine/phosphatidylglycerophosphate/cardiolipin synthase-like enzyme